MKIDRVEILKNTGNNQYEKALYPLSVTSNVLSENGLNLEDELNILKTMLDNSSITSSKSYINKEDNVSEIEVKNPNYTYLDSVLEIYYNGLILIEGYHYELKSDGKVRFIDFKLGVNDELIFKVYNNLRPNLNFKYTNLPTNQQEAMDDIIKSLNDYINLINGFKEEVVSSLNNAGIDATINDSYKELATTIRANLNKTINVLPTVFGDLFSNPYFKIDISFNLGGLFGVKSNTVYFNNNLGNLF